MSDAVVATQTGLETVDKTMAVEEYIFHHVANSKSWHIPGLPEVHLGKIPGFSLHALMVVLAGFFLWFLFVKMYRKQDRVPTGLTNLLEIFVLFIRDDIVVPSLGEQDGRRMTPLFCSFFFFILTLNLMGLIPIFASATANVNVTGALAATSLFFMTFGAMYKNGVNGFLQAFVPHGVPWPVLIMLVPIEMIGILIKSFALMIRLFANMLAGHIVISALVGLVVVFGLAALPAIGLAVGIYLLKILVAFLQAYIFTLLSAIFIGQIYHPAH